MSSESETRKMSMIIRALNITAQGVLALMLIWILFFHIKVMSSKKQVNDDNLNTTNNKNCLIFILIWSDEVEELNIFEDGQAAFIKNECPNVNCYVTRNRNLLDKNITLFDVIILGQNDLKKLPQQRSPRQRYIFASKVSSERSPVCSGHFNNYFNLTFTYKLDSDIVWSYFSVFDKKGPGIGPKLNTVWTENQNRNISAMTKRKIMSKQLSAIFFIRSCFVDYKQLATITKIQHALRKFYIDVKIVNACPEKCVQEQCCKGEDLSKYYFYFIYEDITSEDFVTDEILKAVDNYAIPILFGRTDYSRFLPPKSYIDAGRMKPHQIAITMAQLIASPSEYMKYFFWRNNYMFSQQTNVICQLCEKLNQDTKSVYRNFARWWNPKGYECSNYGYHVER